MPKPPEIPPPEQLAPVFFALGDVTRLRLVALLCAGGAFSITQLTTNTELTRQAVTKHLQVLADAGLVQDLKVGRERLWQFDPAQMEAARLSLEVIGRQWEQGLARLKAFAEGSSD
jgi:DNA-binding transcriptional ArsR family regulator